MAIEVLGVEHIDLTVNDVARSRAFYGKVLHYPWGYWRRAQTEGRDPRPRYDVK